MHLSPKLLLLLTLASIGVLVALVTWRKMNPFLALFVAALVVGLGAGMPALAVLKAFQDGMGATLGGVAAVIALGAMIGKLLAESGGAEVLVARFIAWFGPSRSGWCIIALALTVGLVTWFAIGLLLLLPVLLMLSRETKRPFLLLAIPLLSFLSVMHGLMPPHPGPVVAVEAFGANTGLVLALGFLIGIPTAAVAGPLFARWAVKRVPASAPVLVRSTEVDRPKPSFLGTVTAVGLPVVLMLMATVAELVFPKGNSIREALVFIGNPVAALTLSVFAALWIFGRACRFTRAQMLGFTEQSIAGIAMTIFMIGGGGGFARVLRDAGVADALGQMAAKLHLPPLLYAWLVAAFIRVAIGSATVSITTAAGLLAPVVALHPEINRELLVISLGFGSLFMSHLNDGGFWIVKDCLGLSVGQTLRTWTLTETIVGIAGLGITLLVDMVI